MKKAHNRCLFTRLSDKSAPVHPAVDWIVGNSPGSRALTFIHPAVIID